MTANEIKTAWNTFKKEIAKELDLDLTGCYYMNKKQIENGTATITLMLDWSYDREISYYLRNIENYSSWDGENKERGERYAREYREKIAEVEAKKAAYSTRENEAKYVAEQITSSDAFKKLAAAIGIQRTHIDMGKYSSSINTYQVRIHY